MKQNRKRTAWLGLFLMAFLSMGALLVGGCGNKQPEGADTAPAASGGTPGGAKTPAQKPAGTGGGGARTAPPIGPPQ